MDLQPFFDTAVSDKNRLSEGLPVKHRGFIWFRLADLARFLKVRGRSHELSLARQLHKASLQHDRLRVGKKIYNVWRTGVSRPAPDHSTLSAYLKGKLTILTDNAIKHLQLEPGEAVGEFYLRLEQLGWSPCRIGGKAGWRRLDKELA